MTEENTQSKPQQDIEGKKFYSEMSIRIAVFFGGPLAGGFLVARNLGNEAGRKRAFMYSVLPTFLLLLLFYAVPSQIIESLPNPLIPLIYMAIMSAYVSKTQGEELKAHKGQMGQFFFWLESIWNLTCEFCSACYSYSCDLFAQTCIPGTESGIRDKKT